jgi:ABC-2 type transport system permease protein
MKQLLSIEYAKLRKLSSLKIILFVYMIVGPLWMYVYSRTMEMSPVLKHILGDPDVMFAFPRVWNMVAWCNGCFNVLLGVAVVIIICNEIHFRTMRQNVIDGLSKRDVIVSKFMIVVLLSVFVTLYTALIAFIFGSWHSGAASFYPNSHYIFVYFLQTLGYFSVAFLLASLIQRPALSIVLFIFIFPIEWVVSRFVPYEVSGFLPLRSMSRLTPDPFETIENALRSADEQIWVMPVWMYVVTASVYILLVFIFSYYLLRKRDL